MRTVFLLTMTVCLLLTNVQVSEARFERFRFINLKAMLSLPGLRGDIPNDSSRNVLKDDLNLPRPGDTLLKQRLGYVEPGAAGENKTWDFSRVSPEGENYEVNYFLRSDSLESGIENAMIHSYATQPDAWVSWGYENSQMLVKYEKPEEMIPFPFGYSMKAGGHFYGKGKYCDRLEVSEAGMYYQEADAYGTLILPGGDTLTHVLRIHRLKEVTTQYFPFTDSFKIDRPSPVALSLDSVDYHLNQDSIIRLCDTYQWYAEGYRYPVFEVVSTYKDLAGERIPESQYSLVFHPYDQNALPEDTINLALQDKNRIITSIETVVTAGNYNFKAYPNPVKNELHVELELENPTTVQTYLYDLQGRLLYRGTPEKTQGHYFETVDMSRMVKGTYLLRVDAGGKSVNQKIVKQ